MEEQSFSKAGREVARCRLCREPLYDGDTAYRLGAVLICPTCVDDALIVCRPFEPELEESAEPESEAATSAESEEAEEAEGFPAYLPGHSGKDDLN